MNRHPVAVVGASGYSGIELLRVLLQHPAVDLRVVTSRQFAGKSVAEVFPRFRGLGSAETLRFTAPAPEELAANPSIETAFLALPHGVAAGHAIPLLAAGKKVIDLSADFRLRSPEVYEEFYDHPHPAPELLAKAVYGLPEVRPEAIRGADLIAAPGCYPTSILLPLIPLLKAGLVSPVGISVASMSGVSGAGRKESLPLLFAECNESARAYGVPKHRHLSEIEQELSLAAGTGVVITFVPHLIPVTAGIATTIIAEPAGNLTDPSAIGAALESAYTGKPAVRLLGRDQCPDTRHVTRSRFIDIGWSFDTRANRVLLFSAEDNLWKGASSQAVQCLNLMLGLDETTGLGQH
ncbi:MAG: N-acetyl-gamma-glutamyl-phosphate reductase [Verrucomicrobiales bacterium]